MSTETTAAEDVFDTSVIGAWSTPDIFEVTRDRIAAFAAATNETLPLHLSGEQAPPVFAVVPAFTQLGSVVMEPVPMHLMFKILHGEQDIRIHRPIVPGDVLSSRGRVIGVHGKSSGVVVTTHVETRAADGEVVNDQYFAGFFRGGSWPHEAGEPFPAHEFPAGLGDTEPLAEVAARFDRDQTWRYAEASGDPMPIHTDEEFAQSLGFPGVIVHGLCTMAFAGRAVIANSCPHDPARLRRLAVRFAAVGFPGEQLDTRIWSTGQGATRSYAFETRSGDRSLIKDGLAEIRA